jgi:hypothetical protein
VKILISLVSIFLLSSGAPAAENYSFVLNRFGSIEIKTYGERGEVRFVQGNKESETTLFEAKLKAGAPGVYLTPSGVSFWIARLPRPVVHDRNRGINSGDCRLRITGSGPAYEAVKAKVPVLADFAASGEAMTFYGSAW